ncbi:MAG: glucose-6-phosphate isomerase [Actinomycetes bacterium]
MFQSLEEDPAITPAWLDLVKHSDRLSTTTIGDLVAADPDRSGWLGHEAAGIAFDASRQRVDSAALTSLLDLAQQRGVLVGRDRMLSGEHINVTEDRAVLHTALRAPRHAHVTVDGVNVIDEVHAVLDRMAGFARQIRSGEWKGATGRPISAVVNIGIGGSDLGPAMAYGALRAFCTDGLAFRFVSNVDPTDLAEALRDLLPETTLFIVASKTFTTLETMTNAQAARYWVTSTLGGGAVAQHFVAVSTNAERVADFGIDINNMFGFWDWVGGRYSMMSAIGLSTMIAIGPENFSELLSGAHDMDQHFATADPAENIPLIMGLIAVWNRDFLDIPTTAVLPYSQYLSRFPAYLQQLTMESNGKCVRVDGSRVDYNTGAIYWGEPGTNGQHSFYQLLHQGTSTIASDIIIVARSENPQGHQQDMLVANALAQASVLSMGRNADQVLADGTTDALVPHKVMPGNRPVTILSTQRLTPRTLGALIALYEHSTFVQGWIWGIDSFDQWGVELGKKVAMGILHDISVGTSADSNLDAPTQASVAHYLRWR